MAVVALNKAERQLFAGLSTDTKPTVGVVTGSEFTETDTGDKYLYDGSAWANTSGEERSATWTVVGDSAANAEGVITKAAEANKEHYVTQISVVVRAAAVGAADARVELRSAATVKFDSYFGAAAVRGTTIERNFNPAIKLGTNEAANLVAAAAGAGAITTLSMAGYTL